MLTGRQRHIEMVVSLRFGMDLPVITLSGKGHGPLTLPGVFRFVCLQIRFFDFRGADPCQRGTVRNLDERKSKKDNLLA